MGIIWIDMNYRKNLPIRCAFSLSVCSTVAQESESPWLSLESERLPERGLFFSAFSQRSRSSFNYACVVTFCKQLDRKTKQNKTRILSMTARQCNFNCHKVKKETVKNQSHSQIIMTRPAKMRAVNEQDPSNNTTKT